jgi:hypothetical protein
METATAKNACEPVRQSRTTRPIQSSAMQIRLRTGIRPLQLGRAALVPLTFMRVAESTWFATLGNSKGPCDENLLCTCVHRNIFAFSGSCSSRHHLSDTAMSCVRRHRLYPDSGAMRDGRALLPAQIVRPGCKEAKVLRLSKLIAATRGATFGQARPSRLLPEQSWRSVDRALPRFA